MASRDHEAVEGGFINVYQLGRLLLRYWDGRLGGTKNRVKYTKSPHYFQK